MVSRELPLLIDPVLWAKTRAGARAGRGFRFQDAVGAWLISEAWRGNVRWTSLIPEGVDDVTLHGEDFECRAQVKSRRDPRATFSIAEVATYIAKAAKDLPSDWAQNPRLHLALVLERPLEGLTAPGWSATLARGGQALEVLAEALNIKLGKPGERVIRDLLGRIHLVVEAQPLDRGLDALSTATGPAAAIRLALQQLREQVGRAADANAAGPQEIVMLGASDVQARLDEVQGMIDPKGYLDLTGGLCEIADFEEAVSAKAFHEGVNVIPGHVGAGLVFERPELTAQALEALEARRFVLVAGPSGAGKSALAWLAADATRHTVRWYRVRSLQTEDIAKLVRLAKLLDATPQRQVGFVVDDVGRPEMAGWDALVNELAAHAGVLAIGTVREEDLFVLSTATRSVVVRPKLDESLAERIWSALCSDGKVAFSHWREPFERSRGLLLEYTHLLTEGCRLQETLEEQVRRRLAEDRGDELLLLRTIAYAAAQGAAVDPARLRVREGFDEARFARALHRLIDEHAVCERTDGALTGLHEIRSTYLDDAIRNSLGTSRQVVLASAVETVTSDTFAAFIVRMLRRWPEDERPLLDSLAHRLASEEPQTWSAVFHGLGLATADRIASRWLEISRAADIDDRFSGMMMMLALASNDLSDVPMFAKLKVAQAAFEKLDEPDLRGRLREKMPDDAAPPVMDLEQFHLFAAALVQVAGCRQPPAFVCELSGDATEVPLVPLLNTIRTLSELDVEMADAAVSAAGGTEDLLRRIYLETPWVTCPELGDEDGTLVVTGHVRMIHGEVQDDIHGDVVRLCELMSAAAPRAKFLISQARFSDGSLAGYGDFAIADKRIPRRNLPTPARVAWNRAQMRALNRLVAAPNLTERETALGGAIGELAQKLVEAGDFYCRKKMPGPKWRLFLQVQAWLTEFVQPAMVEEAVANALEQGGGLDNDGLHAFVTGLQRLISELTDGISAEPLLLAARAADLAHDAAALQDPLNWRMTSNPPLTVLPQIAAALWDIRAVLGDVASDPDRRERIAARFGTTSQRHSTLRRAAEDSRRRAQQALAKRREAIRRTFEAHGLAVEVVPREASKDDGRMWPDVEFAVLRKVEALLDFLASESAFVNAANAVPGKPRLEYAPVIHGWVPPLAMMFINGKGMPSIGLAKDWAAHLPYPILEDEDERLFAETLDAIGTLAVISMEKGRGLNEGEQPFFDGLVARYVGNLDRLTKKIQETPDDILVEMVGFLARMGTRLQEEVSGNAEGEPLAVEAMAAVRGKLNEVTQQVLVIRILLWERAANGSSPVAVAA
jgi:hypothetical protein